MLEVNKLDLLDQIIDIGFRRETHQVYELSQSGFRVWDFPDQIQIVVSYEFNRNLTTVRRKVYSILEFLGDIGGLAGSLVAFFGAAIIVFQYKIAVNYMAKYTYATQSEDGELGRIEVGFWQGIKLSF